MLNRGKSTRKEARKYFTFARSKPNKRESNSVKVEVKLCWCSVATQKGLVKAMDIQWENPKGVQSFEPNDRVEVLLVGRITTRLMQERDVIGGSKGITTKQVSLLNTDNVSGPNTSSQSIKVCKKEEVLCESKKIY